jgi:DNA-binding phage protein
MLQPCRQGAKKWLKKRIYANYNEFLNDRLKDPKLAMAYLNEALQDENQNVFLIVLKDVLEAQGEDVSALAILEQYYIID